MILDYDFHPDEESVRVFRTPAAGVLRLDDEVAVLESRCYGGILRHYAFSNHWFKVNVSIDDQGRPTAAGEGPERFAFNCDIATPMEREGQTIFGTDLFIDVLVEPDASTSYVQDEVEFREMVKRDLVSDREAAGALEGLAELLELVETKRLVPWLNDLAAFVPCDPPAAPPMERMAVPPRMQRLNRSTW